MTIKLSELIPNHTVENADVAFNAETRNMSVVINDDLDGAAYIINRDGVIVKSDKCGFDSWCAIIKASEYLTTFERYADEDHFIALEKLNEHHRK